MRCVMANTIEYKGYIGSVEYSSEDKCFFGKLEMMRPQHNQKDLSNPNFLIFKNIFHFL